MLPEISKLICKNETLLDAEVTLYYQQWKQNASSGEVEYDPSASMTKVGPTTVAAGQEVEMVTITNTVGLNFGIDAGLFEVDIASGSPSGAVSLTLTPYTSQDAGKQADFPYAFPSSSVAFSGTAALLTGAFRYQ